MRKDITMTQGNKSLSCDVVIIGGGLSGLRAARTLVEVGVDVLVLEAQNCVGGRTLTEHLDNETFIDHGGQWVSPGQDHIVTLAEELGVSLFSSWGDGLTVDWNNGVRSTYTGMFPPSAPEAEPAARKVAATLTNMADDLVVSAKRAIITLPPTLAGRLRYTPAPPAARDHLLSSSPRIRSAPHNRLLLAIS
jgi:predicted NAD/FAD-dependent oxidoreductase